MSQSFEPGTRYEFDNVRIFVEVDEDDLREEPIKTGFLKALTGGDVLYARDLHEVPKIEKA